MATPVDVLIVGGGVIGLSTAYFLSKEGFRVEVVDRGPLGAESSWAGAGIIPPGNYSPHLNPPNQLRSLSSTLFGDFSRELLDSSGIDNGYRVCGGFDFFLHETAPCDQWRFEGVPFEAVTPIEAQQREPAFTGAPTHGFFFPGMAQVRNPRHLRALIAVCESRGVTLSPEWGIREIRVTNSKATEVVGWDGTTKPFDRLLVAAGAWSESLLAPLGFSAGIHPVRGQIVLLRLPSPILRSIIEVEKNYLVPRDDGRVLVGATEEPEAGFVKQTTSLGVGDLLTFAMNLIPKLAEAEVERAWAGLRPGSLDGWPVLGTVPNYDNVFVATGHYRAGLQLSVGTAKVMTDLIAGKPEIIPLEAFRCDRQPIHQTATFRS